MFDRSAAAGRIHKTYHGWTVGENSRPAPRIQSMARSRGNLFHVANPMAPSTKAPPMALAWMGSSTIPRISLKAPSLAVQCSE